MTRFRPIIRIHPALVLCALAALAPTFARAHFILVEPENWMSQDAVGAPEKFGPCGDEGGGTPTGAVTAFQPGQTIAITINEVIPHPGHYRVALSVNDRSELPAPPTVTPAGGDPCASAEIQDPPVFPVLADNMLPHTQAFSAPQTFFVTLPTDVTCTHCTLQVLEYMSNHPAPCFYHHCADISIGGDPVACGNGQVEVDEECDDGDTTSGDGCDAACRLECGPVAQPKLGIGKLDTAPGDETLGLVGSLTLPVPVTPALDPAADGVRLVLEGANDPVLDVTIPGGAAWSTNRSGTKWTYRSTGGGITKLIIQDRSSVTPGLVRFIVKGKAGSFTVPPGDLPVTARLILGSTAGRCGAATFTTCAFNGSGKKLKCA